MQFRPFESGIEVNGQTVFSVVDGLGKFKTLAKKFLLEAGIGSVVDNEYEIDMNGWYSHDSWLKAFEQECLQSGAWPTQPITLNVKLTYCNSASSKYIYQILETIISWERYGNKPVINWYYDEGDDKMRDDGQDMADAFEYEFNYFPQS